MHMGGIAMRRRILTLTRRRQDPVDLDTFPRQVILMLEDSWLDPCLRKHLPSRARR